MSKVQGDTLRDLLLHKLSSQQSEQLEDQILQDSELADRTEMAANDLLDDYTRGGLQPEDAKLVEKYLLTAPDAPQRLSFAKGLSEVCSSDQRQHLGKAKRPWPAFRLPGFAAAAAAVSLILFFAVLQFQRGQTPLSTAVRTQEKSGTPTTGEQSELGKDRIEGNETPSFPIVLLAAKVRGTEDRTFIIPPGTHRLRIQCEVPQEDASLEFRMILQATDGGTYNSPEGLHVGHSAEIYYVEATFPTETLKAGLHTVSVYSKSQPAKPVVSYSFDLRFRHK